VNAVAQVAAFRSDSRDMARRALLCVSVLAALVAALPAVASAKGKSAKRPAVTLVSPMRLELGDTVTIRGRNFSPKAGKNTVVFRGPNGRSIFVKPIRASRKRLVVKVPAGLSNLFSTRSGDPVATRFTLQVFANGKRTSTVRRLSPVIVPPPVKKPAPAPKKKTSGGTTGGAPTTPAGPPPPCGTGSDWDGDLLSNSLEATLGTDPCKKDTDGDGADDGYEYKSAIDLNDDEFQDPNTTLPYPGKRPYPNPLDGSDANKDFDGDSLTTLEEQALWNYTIAHGATRTLFPLTYSAGEQYSLSVRGPNGRRTPTQPVVGEPKQADFRNWAVANGYDQVMLQTAYPWYSGANQQLFSIRDFDRSGTVETTQVTPDKPAEEYYNDLEPDGYISDAERDEDADGLTNYDETHGRMSPSYWASCYSAEQPNPLAYAGTDYLNPDSDGDGIRDGADDQDHDDIPNVMELSRIAASSGLDDRKGRDCTLGTITPGNFAVTGGPLPNNSVTVAFQGDFTRQNVPQMTATSSLTGGSSPAVTVTTVQNGGSGANERQRISISGTPTGGSFTLDFNGQTTGNIAFDADATTVQSALDEIFPPVDNTNHRFAFGRVNPFNPCEPATWSRTCERFPEFSNAGAPFDDSLNWPALN
jgi:hypothetical protein